MAKRKRKGKMTKKARSLAAKRAWRTRRNRYGKDGVKH